MAHGKFHPWLKYKPPCFLGNNLTAHAHVAFSALAKIQTSLKPSSTFRTQAETHHVITPLVPIVSLVYKSLMHFSILSVENISCHFKPKWYAQPLILFPRHVEGCQKTAHFIQRDVSITRLFIKKTEVFGTC